MNDLINNVYLPDFDKRKIRDSDAYKLLKDNNKDTSVLEGYENIENIIEDIEVESEIIKGDPDFLNKLDEIESRMVKDNTIEEQSQKITHLEENLEKAHEEINELDRTALKIVDSLKHMDDYLKHHGKYYAAQDIDWDITKLGFAEESDYIDKRQPRSKPTRNKDPYLDKNKDPDYPNKNKDDIITY